MTYRVSSSDGTPTPNLVLAVGWALASLTKTGETATIANGSEGAVTIARTTAGHEVTAASLFPPPWLDRVVHLVDQAEETS